MTTRFFFFSILISFILPLMGGCHFLMEGAPAPDVIVDPADDDDDTAASDDDDMTPPEPAVGNCADGIDNDSDGWVDGADAECVVYGEEVGIPFGECDNLVDDDSDGFIDAADPTCTVGWFPYEELPTPPGDDDDSNAGICDDPMTVVFAAFACLPGSLLSLECEADSVSVTCAPPAGGDTIINNIDNSVVYQWIDSFNDNSSSGDDDDSTEPPPLPYEGDDAGECADGADNDLDGLFDCADPGCFGSPDCAAGDDDDSTGDDDDAADDDDSSGDDDDSTPADDDDSTPLPADDLGAYGCTRPYDGDVYDWYTSHGDTLPTGVVEVDTDGDGAPNLVYVSAGQILDVTSGDVQFLDLDNDGDVDAAWTCSGWADGTPDDEDNDGDGYTELDGDCDDVSAGNNPAADEVCGDAFDNDCDGDVDEACESDLDGDGQTELDGDCNDDAPTIYGGAYEWQNAIDDDCDGDVDELNELDGDGDGWCETGHDVNGDGDCLDAGEAQPYPLQDCNDAAANINPEAPDWAGDGNDDNCDGLDEDANLP